MKVKQNIVMKMIFAQLKKCDLCVFNNVIMWPFTMEKQKAGRRQKQSLNYNCIGYFEIENYLLCY